MTMKSNQWVHAGFSKADKDMENSQIRVFLADDHILLLDAFKHMLRHQFSVVGTATSSQELMLRAPVAAPDVIVLAVSGLDGLELARTLQGRIAAGFVFLTTDADPHFAAEALDTIKGASYLTKSSAGAELTKAILCASQGQTYITPHMARAILETIHSHSRTSRPTPRQSQVLKLLAKGKSMKEVGAVLGISARTVAHHKYTMMRTLGIESNAELIHYASRLGIFNDH